MTRLGLLATQFLDSTGSKSLALEDDESKSVLLVTESSVVWIFSFLVFDDSSCCSTLCFWLTI